jgi:hypothetical protein
MRRALVLALGFFLILFAIQPHHKTKDPEEDEGISYVKPIIEIPYTEKFITHKEAYNTQKH